MRFIAFSFTASLNYGPRSFNSDVWPDPAGMAAEVKRLTGAELMVSLWPSVEDLSENYLALQQEGLLAITRDGSGVQDSFEGVYTRLGPSIEYIFSTTSSADISQLTPRILLQESSYVCLS